MKTILRILLFCPIFLFPYLLEAQTQPLQHPGTTGGPVSALNPNLIITSGFLTGAFSSEYGNATARTSSPCTTMPDGPETE